LAIASPIRIHCSARLTSCACSQAENSWQKTSSRTWKSSTSPPATAASASSSSAMPSSVRSPWTLRPRQPAARDGAVADDHQVYVPERARHADRTRPVRGLAVRRIRALPVLDRAGEVELQIGGPGQALDHLAGRRGGQGTLKDTPRAGRITGPQGARPSSISSWTGTVMRRSSHVVTPPCGLLVAWRNRHVRRELRGLVAQVRSVPRAHQAWEHGEAAGAHTLDQHQLVVEGTIELP